MCAAQKSSPPADATSADIRYCRPGFGHFQIQKPLSGNSFASGSFVALSNILIIVPGISVLPDVRKSQLHSCAARTSPSSTSCSALQALSCSG